MCCGGEVPRTVRKCASIPVSDSCVMCQWCGVCVSLTTFLALECSLLEVLCPDVSLHLLLFTETFPTEITLYASYASVLRVHDCQESYDVWHISFNQNNLQISKSQSIMNNEILRYQNRIMP